MGRRYRKRGPGLGVVVTAILVGLPTAAVVPSDAAARNQLGHDRTGVPPDEVIVAIIDTGIDLIPEFDASQVVAWWDFSRTRMTPENFGRVWDPANPVPRDRCNAPNATGAGCRGTALASVIGGRLLPGEFPGVKLAIANIYEEQHRVDSFRVLREALDWAAFTVGADVVLFAYRAPLPRVQSVSTELTEPSEAQPPPDLMDNPEDLGPLLADMRDAGVLVVVPLAGGVTDVGSAAAALSLGPSEVQAPGRWPGTFLVDLIAQGTTDVLNHTRQMDPDVVARGTNVKVSTPDGPANGTGPAFGAALVTAWAARVMQADIDSGGEGRPERVERLLSYEADDTEAPFAFEGFGRLGRANATQAEKNARDGTDPRPPSRENLLAHDEADRLRATIAASGSSGMALVATSLHPETRGFIGPSAIAKDSLGGPQLPLPPTGFSDIDRYVFPAMGGDKIVINLSYDPRPIADSTGVATDIDLLLYRPPAGFLGIYGTNHLVDNDRDFPRAGRGQGQILAFARVSGLHTLLVQGATVGPGGQDYNLTIHLNDKDVRLADAWVGDALGIDPPPVCDWACPK